MEAMLGLNAGRGAMHPVTGMSLRSIVRHDVARRDGKYFVGVIVYPRLRLRLTGGYQYFTTPWLRREDDDQIIEYRGYV
jgi:hypothetical protein